jgi:hypothetical protein
VVEEGGKTMEFGFFGYGMAVGPSTIGDGCQASWVLCCTGEEKSASGEGGLFPAVSNGGVAVVVVVAYCARVGGLADCRAG